MAGDHHDGLIGAALPDCFRQLESIHPGHREISEQQIELLCRELDAGTVLEGTVSKVGEKLRVTARLINGVNGFVQWSESYKRTMDDVFEVQGEITRRVVERFKLSAAEIKKRAPLAARRGLWIVWPKQSSPLAGDLNENHVRAAGLAVGLVDYKVCAVDADWSGLKFARRKN